MLNNVHVVEITAYSDDDAYTIFETMNDRGLSLAPLDMLKSFLIANITDEAERDRINAIGNRPPTACSNSTKKNRHAVKAWLRSQYADSIRESERTAQNLVTSTDSASSSLGAGRELKAPRLAQVRRLRPLRSNMISSSTPASMNCCPAPRKPLEGFEIVYANSWLEFTLQYSLLLAP